MMSLAALAQTSHQAAPAFNADFYAAAATIIPVLFLAIAVQGPLFWDVLRTFHKVRDRITRVPEGRWETPLQLMLAITATGTLFFAICIVVFGAVGEIEALISLSAGHGIGSQGTVLAAAIVLTATAVLGPLIAVFRAVTQDVGTDSQQQSRSPDQREMRPKFHTRKETTETPEPE
jgi:hypothetical protein